MYSLSFNSRAIVSNEDLRPSSPWMHLWSHDFWGTALDHAGSHQSWRPLCVLSFRLNYFWSGIYIHKDNCHVTITRKVISKILIHIIFQWRDQHTKRKKTMAFLISIFMRLNRLSIGSRHATRTTVWLHTRARGEIKNKCAWCRRSWGD